jgi:uncharacterized damage-inducible protein DinB
LAPTTTHSLLRVLNGWQGYQQSLALAVEPLSPEHLAFRPAPHLRSVGELVRHIALGRVTWFVRMDAPGSAELATRVQWSEPDADGNRDVVEASLEHVNQAAELVVWLQRTWGMVDATLSAWTVEELAETYRYRWNGRLWSISRQWSLFRILAHDMHHGGELALMLGLQGLEPMELGALGGHLVLPPPADDDFPDADATMGA